MRAYLKIFDRLRLLSIFFQENGEIDVKIKGETEDRKEKGGNRYTCTKEWICTLPCTKILN